jgi:hypothetical protein
MREREGERERERALSLTSAAAKRHRGRECTKGRASVHFNVEGRVQSDTLAYTAPKGGA